MTPRPIPVSALTLLRSFEQGPDGGPALQAYRCPAGKLTIGWGHTGPDVHEDTTITRERAAELLSEDAAHAAHLLEAKVGADVIAELSDGEYGALVCFVFNLGCGDWTIWRKLKARQFGDVPAEIERFIYAGGKPMNGLKRRRAAEVALWEA